MRNLHLLCALVLLGGSSCQPILRSVYGIKQPQLQDKLQITAYAASHNLLTENSYRIDSLAFLSLLKEQYKPGWSRGFRPIQFLCFDQQGKLTAQWASCEKNLTANILSSVPPSHLLPPDTTRTLKNLLATCGPLALNGQAIPTQQDADYTLVAYWSTWTDKQSLKMIAQLREYIARHPEHKISLLLVNTDFYPGTL